MSTKLKLVLVLALSCLVGGAFVGINKEAKAGSAQYQAENMFVFGMIRLISWPEPRP